MVSEGSGWEMSSLLFDWWSDLLSRLLNMGCVLLRPAITVDGVRYRPLRQLAEGGFSTIQIARDTHSGRKVSCHDFPIACVIEQQVCSSAFRILCSRIIYRVPVDAT
jgi:hypothetical protein